MSTDVLRSSQVRQLWSLMNEAREVPGGRSAQKSHVANGLCRILNAHVCALVVDADFARQRRGQVVDVIDFGWASDTDRNRVWSLLAEQGTRFDPALAACMQRLDAPVAGHSWAWRRDDLVADRDWYGSLIVSEAWKSARVDDSIYAGRQTQTRHTVYGMGVKRAWGERRFTDEDRNLVQLFIDHAEWLWADDPLTAMARLSQRERHVLRCLLEGDSVKQIASRLHISRHTAHQYVKAVYRGLKVHSRGELLALFVRRDLLALLPAPELH
jgi:DNA-binding CsgD family transcriptional regulator